MKVTCCRGGRCRKSSSCWRCSGSWASAAGGAPPSAWWAPRRAGGGPSGWAVPARRRRIAPGRRRRFELVDATPTGYDLLDEVLEVMRRQRRPYRADEQMRIGWWGPFFGRVLGRLEERSIVRHEARRRWVLFTRHQY